MDATDSTSIVVVDVDGSRTGVVVDAVREMPRMDSSSIEPLPGAMAGVDRSFVRGSGTPAAAYVDRARRAARGRCAKRASARVTRAPRSRRAADIRLVIVQDQLDIYPPATCWYVPSPVGSPGRLTIDLSNADRCTLPRCRCWSRSYARAAAGLPCAWPDLGDASGHAGDGWSGWRAPDAG